MYVEPRKMVQMSRFAGQKLRHRCREQTYGHQGGKTAVGGDGVLGKDTAGLTSVWLRHKQMISRTEFNKTCYTAPAQLSCMNIQSEYWPAYLLWTRWRVSLKFICWIRNSQCDSAWRWGLWEVIRFIWGYEDGVAMNGISALMKKDPESSLAPSAIWGHSEKTALYEPRRKGTFIRTNSVGNLILDFQPPEL